MAARVRTTITSSCPAGIVPGHSRDAEVVPTREPVPRPAGLFDDGLPLRQGGDLIRSRLSISTIVRSITWIRIDGPCYVAIDSAIGLGPSVRAGGHQLKKLPSRSGAASVALGIPLSIGIATPAQAAYTECRQLGWVCTWTGVNYTETMYYHNASSSDDGTCRVFSPSAPTRRSAYNRSVLNFRYYSNSNCAGYYSTVASQTRRYDFGFYARSERSLGL
jgi:Peptidase inhibitor family I36